jgi:hypothetical protein
MKVSDRRSRAKAAATDLNIVTSTKGLIAVASGDG